MVKSDSHSKWSLAAHLCGANMDIGPHTLRRTGIPLYLRGEQGGMYIYRAMRRDTPARYWASVNDDVSQAHQKGISP